MIVRILNQGQWVIEESALAELNQIDDQIEAAVDADDAERLSATLSALLDEVRRVGQPVPDESLVDSDLILPDATATLAEVREWLADAGNDEGLIPGSRPNGT